MLSDSNLISFLGIAGAAFQCYWTYTHVPMEKQPLCIVLDDNFNNEDTVFGPGGTFLREVNMDGFLGKLFVLSLFFFFSLVFQTIYSHVT
jgi:hypothetical protein